MATITQTFTSNDKEVQKSLDTLNREMVKLREQAKKTSAETQKWTNDFKRGMEDLSRFAKRVADDVKLPAEKHAEMVKKLNAARATGKITEEQYARALAKSREEMFKQANAQLTVLNNGKKVEQSTTSNIAALGKLAAGYIGITTAIRIFNDELQRKIDLQNKSSEGRLSLANAQRELLLNVGTASPKEREQLMGGISSIAKNRNVSQEMLFRVAPGVTSAQGNAPMESVLSAMDVAATAAPHSEETMRAIATGLLDVSSATKSSDAKENFGTMLGLGRGTRVQSLRMINENLVPAMVGVSQYGDSASEAGSIVSSITSLAKDSVGASSGTAAIALAQQLGEFLPEKDGFKYNEAGKKTRFKGTGYGTTMQRIEALQADPQLRDRFFGTATFEKKSMPAIRDLLTGGSEGDTMLAQRVGEIETGKAAISTADRFFAETGGSSLQKDAGIVREQGAVMEEFYANNRSAARKAQARKAYEDYLTVMDQPFSFVDRWQYNMSRADGVDYTKREVNESLKLLETDLNTQKTFGMEGRAAETQATITALNEILATLKKIETNQGDQPVGANVQGE
jgi:hypothetical protein